MDVLKKYIYIENILSNDERKLLFNWIKLFNHNNLTNFDTQTILGETYLKGDALIDSLLISKKDIFEKESNFKLIESYSFLRLYKKFSTLKPHKDREACEVTVSVNVEADSEWPLFIDDERIIIKPGDGVLYFGGKLKHWREEYNGDYALQIFFHYVKKGGEFEKFKYDQKGFLGAGE